MEISQSEYLATWKRYQAAWSAISKEERAELLAGSVAQDAVYSDPTVVCNGLEELTAKIEQSQEKTPGALFQNTRFLTHHQQGMSEWSMLDARGATLATGSSYACFNDKGLLVQMTGFYELPGQKS